MKAQKPRAPKNRAKQKPGRRAKRESLMPACDNNESRSDGCPEDRSVNLRPVTQVCRTCSYCRGGSVPDTCCFHPVRRRSKEGWWNDPIPINEPDLYVCNLYASR